MIYLCDTTSHIAQNAAAVREKKRASDQWKTRTRYGLPADYLLYDEASEWQKG